jgi:tellurite resistance-related uncharacterized protein
MKIPENAEHYYTTKTFTALTTPQALRHEHRTAEDVWGELVVERGEVLYERLAAPAGSQRVTPDSSWIIEPGVPHRVSPSTDASFHLELYRTSRRNARSA